MRKTFSILSILLVLAFSCENPNLKEEQKVDKLNTIISKQEMKVGYLVFSPCVIKNQQTGELSGIYIDMVNQIAAGLKVKVTWVETNLANFSSGLNSNQFDFCVGPTFVTIPRATAVAFTQPVNYVGNSGVVLKNGKFKAKAIQELNKKGTRISVLQGQAMEEFCKRNFPQAELISLSGSDLTAPLLAVSSNKSDIGFMNTITVINYSKEHSEVEPAFTANDQLEILPLSWTTRFEDQSLLAFLNSSILYLKTTGRLAEYQNKYDIKILYDITKLERIQ